MCGFIAQLVEQRTGNAEVTGSNPVEALIFFRLLLSNCFNWKTYCDDHSSLSSTTAVQKGIISYTSHDNIALEYHFEACHVLFWSLSDQKESKLPKTLFISHFLAFSFCC